MIDSDDSLAKELTQDIKRYVGLRRINGFLSELLV